MVEVNESSPVRGALGRNKSKVRIVSDSETTDAAYQRLFDTRDGKVVLADLMKKFYDGPMEGADLSREMGKRDVLYSIKKRVTR